MQRIDMSNQTPETAGMSSQPEALFASAEELFRIARSAVALWYTLLIGVPDDDIAASLRRQIADAEAVLIKAGGQAEVDILREADRRAREICARTDATGHSNLRDVACPACGDLDGCHLPAKSTETNPRLIRHAPDLLAACQAAADLLLRCDGEKMPGNLTPASDDDWDRVAEQLTVAIGKATVQP
jgi:hypothetical protein